MLNETLSLESTLESPSKPHQSKSSSSHKSIFCVHYMGDYYPLNQNKDKINDTGKCGNLEKKVSKNSKKEHRLTKINKVKNLNHILDYDNLLSKFFPPKKNDKLLKIISKKTNNKSSKKLLGHKRSDNAKDINNKSKYNIINYIIYFYRDKFIQKEKGQKR
jgi:hypothetical protein